MKFFQKIFLTAILLCGLFILKAQNIPAGHLKAQQPVVETGIISIDDTENIWAGYSYEPKATFQNFGNSKQSFDVTMEIGTGYSCSRRLTLSPQASITVIFNPLLLNAGTHTFSVKTHADKDCNPLNDTLSQTVVVTQSGELKAKN